MKRGTKRSIEQKQVRDKKKEQLFNMLVEAMQEKGVQVRREKLKQGFGWRAVSGSCQLNSERLVLVDARMGQDEQIEFMLGKIRELNLDIETKELQSLAQ